MWKAAPYIEYIYYVHYNTAHTTAISYSNQSQSCVFKARFYGTSRYVWPRSEQASLCLHLETIRINKGPTPLPPFSRFSPAHSLSAALGGRRGPLWMACGQLQRTNKPTQRSIVSVSHWTLAESAVGERKELLNVHASETLGLSVGATGFSSHFSVVLSCQRVGLQEGFKNKLDVVLEFIWNSFWRQS